MIHIIAGKGESMDRPTLVVFVRHAESARNVAKKGTTYFADEYARSLVRGIPDQEIEITLEGKLVARKTGDFLREKFGTFDCAYHSGYERTIQTLDSLLLAYPEAERSLIKVRQNPFIRERHPGYTYDMTEDEAEAAFPYLKEYWKTHGGFMAEPPGGESLATVVARVYIFMNMLFRDRAGQKILVVTHGGTLRCIRYLLERWTYKQAEKWPQGQTPKNCGVTYYLHNEELNRLVLGEYNLTVE